MYEITKPVNDGIDNNVLKFCWIETWCKRWFFNYPLNFPPAMTDWCIENLSEEWYFYFSISEDCTILENMVFSFAQEEDAMAFKLRWL